MNKLCVSLGHCCGPVTMAAMVRGRGMRPYWATGMEREGGREEIWRGVFASDYFSHWSHLHLLARAQHFLLLSAFPPHFLSKSLQAQIIFTRPISVNPSRAHYPSASFSLTVSISLHPHLLSLSSQSAHLSPSSLQYCQCVCVCVYTSCWFPICCSHQLTGWTRAADASDLCLWARVGNTLHKNHSLYQHHRVSTSSGLFPVSVSHAQHSGDISVCAFHPGLSHWSETCRICTGAGVDARHQKRLQGADEAQEKRVREGDKEKKGKVPRQQT